jgi:hypothetical protein
MTTGLIELNKQNTSVEFISTRNNVIVAIKEVPGLGDLHGVAVNKKYFNRIHIDGAIHGRIRLTPDNLWIFEGFSFR